MSCYAFYKLPFQAEFSKQEVFCLGVLLNPFKIDFNYVLFCPPYYHCLKTIYDPQLKIHIFVQMCQILYLIEY